MENNWGNSGEGDEKQPPKVYALSARQIWNRYSEEDTRGTNGVPSCGRAETEIPRAFRLFSGELHPRPQKCFFAAAFTFSCFANDSALCLFSRVLKTK
jgi:hypothetical protein